MRANVNNRLDTACTGLNTSYKMTMRLLPPSDGGSGGLHIEDESFSASLPQRRGSARDLDQLLVSRKLVDPGQAALSALDVGPTDNAVPVHQELAGELDLMPLEF